MQALTTSIQKTSKIITVTKMKYTNAGGAEKETFVWKTMPPRKVVEE